MKMLDAFYVYLDSDKSTNPITLAGEDLQNFLDDYTKNPMENEEGIAIDFIGPMTEEEYKNLPEWEGP